MKKRLYSLIKLLFGVDIVKIIDEREVYKKQFENSREDIEKKTQQLKSASDINKKLMDKIKQLEVALKTAKASLLEKNAKSEKLHKELELKSGKKEEKAEAEQKMLSDKVALLEESLALANKHKAETLRKKDLEFDSLSSKLISQIKTLEEENKKADELNGAIKKEHKQLKEEHSATENKNLELKTLIEEAKQEQSELQNTVKDLTVKIATIAHQPQHAKTTQRLPDGTLIEHEGLNVGERQQTDFQEEEKRFEYNAHFQFNMHAYNQGDAEKFPHLFYPKLNTPILNWQASSSNVTSGVTEPLLIQALQKLTELVPAIEIHQNTLLSIRNRDYAYRPDIALVWKKHNLYIDIEVDEPYDMVSRKPIHYITSADYLRNLYFISQGWVVVRFSEEQVYKETNHCVQYIANVLKKITSDTVFDALIANFEVNEQDRWTYDGAKELEAQKYRESYLNIEASTTTEDDDDAIDSTPFEGTAPDMDILPENEVHATYEEIINSKSKEYIRVTIWPMEYQRIYSDYKIETKNYRHSLLGYDVAEKKYNFVVFDTIMKVEPLDSPFKYPLLERNDDESYLAIKDLLFEAIYNCNPIRIKYEDAYKNITVRNITYVSYHGSSTEYYCDEMWSHYYGHHSVKIQALCLQRDDHRSFYDYRIKTIQVFNLRDIGIGHIHSFPTALWYPIKENDMEVAHRIAELIPQYIVEKDLFIILTGNYAHYLLLSGKTDQALELYRRHEGLQINEDLSWETLVLKDFEELKDIADYKEKFDAAKQLLGWS